MWFFSKGKPDTVDTPPAWARETTFIESLIVDGISFSVEAGVQEYKDGTFVAWYRVPINQRGSSRIETPTQWPTTRELATKLAETLGRAYLAIAQTALEGKRDND